MAKIGDKVRFLSSTGGGRVVKIDGQIAHVEEEDGFVTPVMLRELVVVAPAGEEENRKDIFGGTGQHRQERERETQSKFVPTKVPEAPKPEPVIETPEGEKLNVTLAFAAMELKHLTTTSYEAYLVNDSNYSGCTDLSTTSGIMWIVTCWRRTASSRRLCRICTAIWMCR